MDWKSTEELYGELLTLEREAQEALNVHYSAEDEIGKLNRKAQEALDEHRWKVADLREVKEELLKRSRAQPIGEQA